jgi:septal ring-binding cell division protein DamX
MRTGSVLVVEADTTPIKEVPEDKQGEEFPNKDKTIYDAIAPSEQKVEKLLPEAEEPVIPEPAVQPAPTETAKTEAGTTTFVNKALTATETVEDPVDAQSLKQGGPEATPEAPKAVAPKPAPVVAAPKEEPKKAELVVVAPKTVNVKPTIPAAPKPVVAPKPAVKPAAAVAMGGSYKIQLGAVGSDAEARQYWSKLQAKHGDILKGSPIIVKADVNGKTYYRLRATGFADAAATKAACAKLSARGQACMPAGK